MHTVAVDINPAENALLELKIAAIKYLSYEDYLLVLGDKEDTENKRCKLI
jgi:S-adenosylmethionine:diacylglycerol 3-amino-3-carboxypropyl transferase